MKSPIYTLLFFALLIVNASCKKASVNPGLISFNVIQATTDVPSVYVYFTATPSNFYQQQAIIPYAASAEYGIAPNTPLVVVSSADTSKNLLSGTLHLKNGGIYSLYLAGPASHLDTLLLQDQIPVHADSSSGVRFINLSSGRQPITVNLQGNPSTQTEFPVLAYKHISSFKSYPATSAITSYNFEIRDQASGLLLSTFTWNLALFKNNTIVICGSEDPTSSTPVSAFQVNNY